jgi:hypothetical protein
MEVSDMNEVEFAGFIKRGLGTPAAPSPALVNRLSEELYRPERKRRPLGKAAKGVLLLAAVAALLVPTAVVATSLLTPHDVAVGMPGGSLVFQGTNPTCVVVTDGVEYRCTLAHAPTVEIVSNYLGAKQILQGPDKTVTGGCIATTSDGLHWQCYIGDAAVQHGILVKSLLGQPVTTPSVG